MTSKRPGNLIGDGQEAIGAYLATLAAFRARRTLLIVAARGLLEARRRYPDNRTFGRWLRRSAYASLSKNDRASLISIARNEKQLARFLKSTNIASPTLLWRTARKIIADDDGGPP